MILYITPLAAPRPRFSKFGTYNPAKYTQFKKDFLKLAKSQGIERLDGPIRMEVIFFMPIPKSTSKKKTDEMESTYHTKKPDADNLVKSVKDSLEGYAYKNDSQICELKASKLYSCSPRIQLNLYDLS